MLNSFLQISNEKLTKSDRNVTRPRSCDPNTTLTKGKKRNTVINLQESKTALRYVVNENGKYYISEVLLARKNRVKRTKTKADA